MSHAHLLILGTSGSGKTSLGRQLLQLTPRAVIVDPQEDYVNDPGVDAFPTFRELSAELMKRQHDDAWRLAYAPDRGALADGGFRAVMAFVYQMRMAERDRLGGETPAPIGFFLEEASIYSDASRTPPELDWIIRAGRKAGINTVSVVQSDVDISKAVRRLMTLQVLFRLHEPTQSVRRIADPGTLAELETLRGPAAVPEYGVHYLTRPPESDPHSAWRAVFE